MAAVVVNDILDALRTENQRLVADLKVLSEDNERFLQDLCLERQLNHVLDNYKNYSLILIQRCKCDINADIISKLNQFNDEYKCLKHNRRSDDPNAGLLSGTRGSFTDPSEELITSKNMVDDLTDNHVVCDECQQTFETTVILEIHRNSVHKNVESYTCHKCELVFNCRDLFSDHLSQHDSAANDDHMDIKPDIHSLNASPKSSPMKSLMKSPMKRNWTKVAKMAKNNGINHNYKLMTELLHKTYQNVGKKGAKVVTNTSGKKYPCTKCRKGFDTEHCLELHVNRIHLKKKPFSCTKCVDRFYANRLLLAHMSAAHNVKAFECDSCDYKGFKYLTLMQHQKRHQSPSSAPKVATNGAQRSPSKSKASNVELYKCDSCDFETTAKYSYVLHKNSHKLNKQFRCVVSGCNEKFMTEKSQLRHQKDKHSLTDKRFACKHCSERFFTNDSLRNHLGTKHKVSAFACDMCAFKTTTRVGLFRHKVADHSVDAAYVCRFAECNTLFENQYNLDRHYKRVHKSDSGQTSGTSSLTKGQKPTKQSPKKTGLKPGPKPGSKSSPKSASKSPASDGNPLKCDVSGCRKKFATEGKLFVHKRVVHKMTQMIACDWSGCKRKFISLTKLTIHKRDHKAMENKFPCVWKGCTFRTDTFAKLNQHRRQLKHNSDGL